MLKNLRLFKTIRKIKLHSYQQPRSFCSLNKNKEIIYKQISETDFILCTNTNSIQINAFLNQKDTVESYLDYIQKNKYSQENKEIIQITVKTLVNLFSNIKEEIDKSSFYLSKNRIEVNEILDKVYNFSLDINNYLHLPIELQKNLTLSLANLLSSKMIVSIPLLDFLINYLDNNYHLLFPMECLELLKLLLIMNYRTKCTEASNIIGCYVLSNFFKFDFTQFTTLIFYLSSFPLIKTSVWKYLENDCQSRIRRLFNSFSLFKLVFGFYLRIKSEVDSCQIPTIKDHSYSNLLNLIEQTSFVEFKDEVKFSLLEREVILLMLQELNKNIVEGSTKEFCYRKDILLDKKHFYSLYLKFLRGVFIESNSHNHNSNIKTEIKQNTLIVQSQIEAITDSLENLNRDIFDMQTINNPLLKTPSNFIYSMLFLFKQFNYSHNIANLSKLLSYSMNNINLKAKLELLRSYIKTKQYKEYIDLSIEPNNLETFCVLIDLIILKKDLYSKVLVNDSITKVSLMLKKGFEEKIIDDMMKLITLFAYFSNRFDFKNNFISIRNDSNQLKYDSSLDHIVFRVCCYYTEDIMRRKEKNNNITEEEKMILDAYVKINTDSKESLRIIDINKCHLLKSFALYNNLSKTELESIFSNKLKLI